jgi:hypothetical protein
MGSSEEAPAALVPAYELGEHANVPVVLWEGGTRLLTHERSRPGRVLLRWGPRMDVVFEQDEVDEGSSSGSSSAEDIETFLRSQDNDVQVELAELGVTPGLSMTRTFPAAGLLTSVQVGDASQVTSLRFHLVNFPQLELLPHVLDEGSPYSRRGRLEFEGGGWRVRLDQRREIKQLRGEVREVGGYAITHVGAIDRTDGAAFPNGDVKDVLRALQILFSFARGAWTSPMLPVGYNGRDERVWFQWLAMHVSAGEQSWSWLDKFHPESLREVGARFLELWPNPVWRDALPKAVNFLLEANRQGGSAPSFLEVRYTWAQAGLEGLALAILREDPVTSSDTPAWAHGSGAAEKNIRALLEWVEVTDIPEQLTALRSRAKQMKWPDAAPALPWMRNKVIHPKPAKPGDPTNEEELEGVLLATWLIELVLLRRLGYTGEYAPRLVLGRWQGSTIAVPWARTTDS